LIGLAFVEASKYVLPARQPKNIKPDESILISACVTSRLPQLLFHKFRPEMFRWLLAELTTSQVCKLKEKPSKVQRGSGDADDEKENVEPEPAAKRQRKVAVKSKPDSVSPLQVMKNGSDRPKMWLDDVFHIVSTSFRDDEAKIDACENPDKMKVRLLRKKGLVVSLALQFCWSMRLSIKQDSADKWSSCRAMIKARWLAP
jgi:hypothetical protein